MHRNGPRRHFAVRESAASDYPTTPTCHHFSDRKLYLLGSITLPPSKTFHGFWLPVWLRPARQFSAAQRRAFGQTPSGPESLFAGSFYGIFQHTALASFIGVHRRYARSALLNIARYRLECACHPASLSSIYHLTGSAIDVAAPTFGERASTNGSREAAKLYQAEGRITI